MLGTLKVPGTSLRKKPLRELLRTHHIYEKKEITIIVTDSGVGGISVAAELYCQLKEKAQYEKVRILYFNSLFDADSGYNRLESLHQKVHMFNSALYGMLNYSPDLILIACNILSLLYPYTSFAKSIFLPVVGIVEIGVNYILTRVGSDKNSLVIIFATPATIAEGTHKSMLAQSLPDTNVIEQACPELAFAIGDGEKRKIKQLIHKYTAQAIQKLDTKHFKIYASLNCTHFGYYQDEFLQAFQQNGIRDVEILNPNSEMVNLVVPEKRSDTPCHPDITIEFVSKVKIHPNGINSLIPFIEGVSKEAAVALQNYFYNPELF